ncbi:MAG: tripartite tricarboxylate transporter substrate binding protein [Burkholderiales bacterium]
MITKIRITSLLAAWFATTVPLLATHVVAQTYPTKPVRVVIPYAAGGLPDTMTRLVAARLTETLKQQFVIDNRPGAGGIGACELVARANADGYTLMVADVGQTAINPALYARLPYDPVKDFTAVSIMGTSAQFIAVNSSVPANTLNELIALAKAKPGALRYGSGGIGSLHHLTVEALNSPLKLGLVHVPYKGTGQSIPALLSGEVAIAMSALPAILPHRAAGRVKLLAVNTAKRAAQAPEVPTVGEVTGLKDFDYPPVIGILAPSGTPRSLVNLLSKEIAQAVKHRDVVQRYTTLGIDPVGSTPEEYTAQNRADLEKYAKVVKAAGLKAE